ncbi:hypothetical protein GCM10010168_56590 [Actinoplanes ianthinogenes]|uniref:Uncharacterized protein n=1 Tax=Actinoplanes ianthinogenes TaxID=122358 RepID=A0ABM7M2Z5_9ACTN|nr:hypothetical protein [Actinoplanes ianthinogenes]BCJ45921.1 hypothetical protein Aiant_65780 [Actinoplanes ianthinogenes]GGR31129.1 hypothetical protein GCM10010168_56590 [Actinoplanes ianthinogenes]
MIWHRISEHRALAVANAGRWYLPFEPPPARPAGISLLELPTDESSVTVAVVREPATGCHRMVSRLAELAAADELLVVLGSDGPALTAGSAVIAGLRRRLTRHHVVPMPARQDRAWLRENLTALHNCLADGSLPVLVTSPAALHSVAAETASSVHADRVVGVRHTPADAELVPIWHRQPVVALAG